MKSAVVMLWCFESDLSSIKIHVRRILLYAQLRKLHGTRHGNDESGLLMAGI